MEDLSPHIEAIARRLLGEPNGRLSTKMQLRFGNNGAVAVEIGGPDRGKWFDHENQVGGGAADMVRYYAGIENGALLSWVRSEIGIEINTNTPKPTAEIVATYGYHDEKSELFEVCRLQPKTFRQRRPDGKGGWEWRAKGTRQVPYRLPQLIATAIDETIYIVEGEKDVDRLREIGFTATCNAGGAGKWRGEFGKYFRDRDVVLIPDNDDAGRDHARKVAASLQPVAKRVRILDLPDLPHKGDVSDWLDAGGAREQLAALAAVAQPFEQEPELDAPRDVPVIVVRAGRRHEAADAGLAALRSASVPLYQRDRSLVRVCMVPAKTAAGDVTATPGILDVGNAYLSRELGRVARWQQFDRHQKLVDVDPPRPVVEQIAEMAGEWPFDVLTGVIGTPTMRPDYSLLLREGYDPMTGLVLLGAPAMPPIPDEPSRDQAEAALRLLNTLLDEFPFRDGGGKDSVDRAVALSELLTSILRGAMQTAPMHLANAPQPGTGKSYLADLASEIATGERCAAVAFSPNPEESEKRFNGAALAGHPIIALDNASGTIEGDLLCQITERPLLQLRPLGSSKQIRAPNTFTVLANGNNAVVADDMVRRTIECRLDANMESPETRTFRDNPLDRIRQNRGAYVAASLTLARAYVTAGIPGRPAPLPSYEAWSDLVRAPLIWLGYADPVASMSSLRSLDPGRQARAAVFRAWADELGTGGAYLTADLVGRANDHGAFGGFLRPNLRDSLMEVARDRRGGIDAVRLGRWLGKAENTIAAGFKLASDRGDAARPRWVLDRA